MRWGGLLLVLGLLGCPSSEEERTVLDASDLEAIPGETFDHELLVPQGALTDADTLDAAMLLRFLEKTSYGRPSFLATYQSNGVRAAEAMVRAAKKYRVNPLALLVRAQIAEGLVSLRSYPDPPSRVEYAFRCGCPGPTSPCAGETSGFDRQVDCIAAEFRQSLDLIGRTGTTAGGWGTRVAQRTLDDVMVRPKNEDTAAIYQSFPIVGIGRQGTWVFWNLWNKYAETLDYVPPPGGRAENASWVGDVCSSPRACAYSGAVCLIEKRFPDGLCSAKCTADCPTQPGRVRTFCAAVDGSQQEGYCLSGCNPTIPTSCRPGFRCERVKRFGSGSDSDDVCVPAGG